MFHAHQPIFMFVISNNTSRYQFIQYHWQSRIGVAFHVNLIARMATILNPYAWIVFLMNLLCVPVVYSDCPSNWLTVNTSSTPAQTCYKLFPTPARSYNASAAFCRSQGGYLARDTSAAVHNALKPTVLSTSTAYPNTLFWFGLTDYNTTSWYWLAGPKLGTYTNFVNKNALQSSPNARDCGYIAQVKNNFKWVTTTNCNASHGTFCQRDFDAPPIVSTTVRPVTCPNGWYSFPSQQTCIQLFSSPNSWSAAQAQCQMANAKLVRIDNADMNTFVNYFVGRNKGLYWIGLNDKVTEGTFTWLNDTVKASYTQWASGMPNNAGGKEDCVVIDGYNNNKWNDLDCTTPNRYICQQAATAAALPSPVPKVTASNTNCGPGWEDVKDTDYCIAIHTNLLSWMDARADCKRLGGDLASVASVQEQYYLSGRVVAFASNMFWIGANDRAVDKGWLWSDGTPLAFLNWDVKQPDNLYGSSCAVMVQSSGRWDDISCQSKNGYICKKKGKVTLPSLVTTTTEPANVPDGQMWGCPVGWEPFRGSCYKLVRLPTDVDWATASSTCTSPTYQSSLVAIIDEEENNFVFALLPEGFSGYTWIGFHDPQENSFTWVDDTPVQYTNWELNEPNNNNNEDCVVMDSAFGQWNDIDCSDIYPLFVCKKSKSFVPKAGSDMQQGCTDGSLGYGAQCYTFITSPKNFYDAQKDCLARSQNLGNLATVDSGHLQSFLAAEVSTSPVNSYWIGLQQNNTTYIWQSNWPVSFTYWGSNHTGNERGTCVGMQHSGLWTDYPCSQTSMSYICESPRTGFTTAATPAPVTNQGSCPTGWTGYGTRCYHAFIGNISSQLTWLEARQFCANQATGGALVTVDSNATQTWLKSSLLAATNTTTLFWIGLNDRDIESGYIWDDKSPYVFANWLRGQPNDQQGRQDCVEWILPQNVWNDDYCYTSKNWICQVPKGSVITTPVTAPTAVSTSWCGNSSWVGYKYHCYFISPSDGPSSTATWFDAQRTCKAMNAELASIVAEDENGFITSLISKNPVFSFWIGLNDLDMDTYGWTDFSPVSYVSWARNEPNNNYGAESCVQINSVGTWSDNQCQRSLGYICKKWMGNYHPSPRTSLSPAGGCPPNFVSLPALPYCYYVGGTTNTTRAKFDDANAACDKMYHNSELASIHSTLEQKYILTLISNLRTPAWIGFHDRLSPNKFYWVDNLEVSYTNWGPGQPDESKNAIQPGSKRDCVDVEVRRNPGTWRDRNCNTSLAYVCEAKKDPTIPTAAPNSTGCHQGYQRFRNSCYKFFSDSYDWTNAQNMCQLDGGNLVTVSSGIEQAFVEIVTSHVNDSLQFWLGLKYNEPGNAFSWQDSWPVLYTNWGHGEPNTKGNQNCVTNTLDGQWHAANCTDKFPFVCEINFGSPPPTRTFSFGICPKGNWYTFNGNCYHLESASPKSWAAANAACTLLGASLASIHSDSEAQALSHYLENVGKDVWIGLFKGQAAGFTWYDGTEVEYLNWAAGEPNDPESYLHQDCVKIRNQDSEWADTDCFDENAYLCKAPQVVITGINPFRTLPSGQTRRSLASGQTRPQGFNSRPPNPNAGKQTGTSSSSGLNSGGVAGVVVGTLLLVTVAVIFGVLVYRRTHGLNPLPFIRQQETTPESGIENASYSTTDGAKLNLSEA